MDCTLSGGDLAPGAARRVLDRFAPELGERRLADARLLVSELVTNCVRHGGAGGPEDTIELHLACAPGRLHVEVVDHGEGFDPTVAKRSASATRDGGRGLYLIDALADRWGVTNGGLTLVWFDLTG
jgi:anti-sigma regulatory factor (Ser/Thr protein kinase)